MTDRTQSESPLSPFMIGMILFPNFTLLDFAGPCEVFGRFPNAYCQIVAASLEPVRTDHGIKITPYTTFADALDFDLLFVPGGPGQIQAMEDQALLDFLRKQGQTAKYITSVCTGSLLLGAAGLLQGYRATSHWRYIDLLSLMGAEPVRERVVIDRNRITGAGVSSGIDFALEIALTLFGKKTAQTIQLNIEYDPQPPFNSGSPGNADPALLQEVSASLDRIYEKRMRQIKRMME
jgi:cyclohexyl-isocyanide hydratase